MNDGDDFTFSVRCCVILGMNDELVGAHSDIAAADVGFPTFADD
jgi:hypothetical protein